MSKKDTENSLGVIQRAVHNEISGQHFYSDAAYYCIDPWAKEIFASLAREEEDHMRLLLVEYEALTNQGQWLDLDTARAAAADIDITLFTFPDAEPTVELFPPEWRANQAIDRRADDLIALAFGVRMEEKAIALYREEARTTADPAAKEAYEFLIEEETRHYHQLKTQWEKLAGKAFQER